MISDLSVLVVWGIHFLVVSFISRLKFLQSWCCMTGWVITSSPSVDVKNFRQSFFTWREKYIFWAISWGIVFGKAVFNQILISEKVLHLTISRIWVTSRGWSVGHFEFRGRIIYLLNVHWKKRGIIRSEIHELLHYQNNFLDF